jgi:hypothetical protein
MANDIGIVLQKATAKLLTMKRLPYFSEREGNFRWSDLWISKCEETLLWSELGTSHQIWEQGEARQRSSDKYSPGNPTSLRRFPSPRSGNIPLVLQKKYSRVFCDEAIVMVPGKRW